MGPAEGFFEDLWLARAKRIDCVRLLFAESPAGMGDAKALWTAACSKRAEKMARKWRADKSFILS